MSDAPLAERPLRVALVGYGRMGRAAATICGERGHQIAAIVSRSAHEATAREVGALSSGSVDVALEFSQPAVAAELVRGVLDRGIPCVSGTTGWNEELAKVLRSARAHEVGFLHAANFSLGMAVLGRLTRDAAQRFARLGGFEPYLSEAHHAGKRDAPSGTALWLAQLLQNAFPQKTRHGVAPADQPIPADMLSIAWVRAGAIPGTHCVGFAGPDETLELVHTVRQRAVFARGAVWAAERLVSRRGAARLEDWIDEAWPHQEESR